MDLSIFPAVALLVMVLFNIPHGNNGGELSAQTFRRSAGVHDLVEEPMPVHHSGRNAFRKRLSDVERIPRPSRSAFRSRLVSEDAKVAAPLKSDPALRMTSSTSEASSTTTTLSSSYPAAYPSLNPNYSMAGPERMANDLDAKEDELNYRSIYTYIRDHYKRVPDQEADLIAKSLVEYGRKHDLDPKFAAAVMARESAFNRHAISATGARGLGQIKSFNFQDLNIEDPHNIEQNTQGTVKYLKNMLGVWKDKSDSMSLALASYYKGQGAVRRNNGQLDPKTTGYVNDIMKTYDKLKLIKDDQK